ncbi:VWA domain-containing protein [Candidatus Parcubacteria bacterium]|nr:VWA domain-containing protein [Candidatus Parcubacteria bacterium]
MALLRLVKSGSGQEVVSASAQLKAIRAKYLPDPDTVYMLLDCSGSMAGDKLGQAKNGIANFAKKTVISEKKVGLVTFSSQPHLVEMGALSEVEANGSTNMADAIAMAVENMPKSGDKTIVIATDGAPDNRQKTLKIASSAKECGIKIICIGTDDADKEFLKKLASLKDLGIKVSQREFGEAIANSVLLLN